VCVEDFSAEKLRRYGQMGGMAHDLLKGTTWVFSEGSVYEVIVTNEDRHVWELFLEKGMFEQAEKFAKNPIQRDKVNSSRGDYYFGRKQYSLAAKFYGKTHRSFEEVTLKFIRESQQEALKTYLLTRLDHLGDKDRTQLTLVCTWLVELYLNKLNEFNPNTMSKAQLQEAKLVQEEFQQFLVDQQKANTLSQPTIFNLISSHGRIRELLFYAELVQDYERVIGYFLQQPTPPPPSSPSAASSSSALVPTNEHLTPELYAYYNKYYLHALQIMSKQSNAQVFYKFSPALMEKVPFETVNTWIRKYQILKPRLLLPALMRYKQENNPPANNVNQAIRYLKYCVKKLKCDDLAIHNLLLSLYSKQADEKPLLQFLNKSNRFFDLEYALRVCMKEKKYHACVLIYGSMGLYEESVDLALRHCTIELAKENADKPEDDAELRKKLWLRIARHVVEEEQDLTGAVALLSHCDLLKIEDILPFFPDFSLIDNFKDLICSSLEDYNRNIDERKREMTEATRSANLIRDDISQLRNKYTFVGENQPCDHCGFVLLSRAFYIFPCQHVFHTDCLKSETLKFLDPVKRKQLISLEQKLADIQFEELQEVDTPSSAASSSASASSSKPQSSTNIANKRKIQEIQDQIDDIVSGGCLFCGDVMINSIDLPFIKPSERSEINAWSLN